MILRNASVDRSSSDVRWSERSGEKMLGILEWQNVAIWMTSTAFASSESAIYRVNIPKLFAKRIQ